MVCVGVLYTVSVVHYVHTCIPMFLCMLQLDETRQQLCSLTDLGCCRVMSSLLVELLFLRGEECCNTASDLPRLFQEHFGFPLPLSLLKVDSPTALLALHEIHDCIQVIKPVCRVSLCCVYDVKHLLFLCCTLLLYTCIYSCVS